MPAKHLGSRGHPGCRSVGKIENPIRIEGSTFVEELSVSG
jgi:hypothetical protein